MEASLTVKWHLSILISIVPSETSRDGLNRYPEFQGVEILLFSGAAGVAVWNGGASGMVRRQQSKQ